jgi:hypothetical protein
MATVAQARGIFSGGIILTLFGSFWCVVALGNWAARPAWSIPLGAAEGKRNGILFGIIFGVEGGSIPLASIVLARQGLGEWIPFSVALIVGVHFLPLAHLFRVPLYYATGILAVLGVLACLPIHDPSTRVLCECVAMVAVLWFSVAYLLLRTRITVPQTRIAPPE